ncbi:MAG: hypothetical protein NTY45_10690 [Elusimicrobia bacterium]|nr:hypothetical protein [Elusimicrobiota bacterium]
MVSTTGWVTLRELTEATGFKPAALKKTLKTMAAGDLAELAYCLMDNPVHFLAVPEMEDPLSDSLKCAQCWRNPRKPGDGPAQRFIAGAATGILILRVCRCEAAGSAGFLLEEESTAAISDIRAYTHTERPLKSGLLRKD